MKKLIALLSVITLVSGCVLPPQGRIETWQMSPKMQNRGFSVKRPSDSRWYLMANEQNPSQALFRLSTDSSTHSVFTSISLGGINNVPQSLDEFEKEVKSMMTTSYRVKNVEYKSSQSIRQGQWCINYSIKGVDHSAENSTTPLVMTTKGFVVLHPSWQKTIIDAMVSQRGLASEIDPELDKAGFKLLEGVRLESAPGKEL